MYCTAVLYNMPYQTLCVYLQSESKMWRFYLFRGKCDIICMGLYSVPLNLIPLQKNPLELVA